MDRSDRRPSRASVAWAATTNDNDYSAGNQNRPAATPAVSRAQRTAVPYCSMFTASGRALVQFAVHSPPLFTFSRCDRAYVYYNTLLTFSRSGGPCLAYVLFSLNRRFRRFVYSSLPLATKKCLTIAQA